MDWTAPTWWWLAAGVLVGAELLSGTFYLLMLALGCAAAALAAHLGANAVGQIAVAAITGAGATAAWHFKRARSPRSAPAASNPDVNIDIGQRVMVRSWAANRSAQVHYRGSTWSARLADAAAPRAGEHVIVAVSGNQLHLAPVEPQT